MKHLVKFFKDEEGVTAIEYGLIAALIVIVCVGAIKGAGTSLSGMWTSVDTELQNATAGGGGST